MGKTIKALFRSPDDRRLLDAIIDGIEEEWGPCTEEGMPEEIRTFILVYGSAGLASNGGLQGFLSESTEDLSEVTKAFEDVGAVDAAAQLGRVAAQFPDKTHPQILLPAQKEFLNREVCAIFPSDVIPELGAWVRARSKPFLALPQTDFVEEYAPLPVVRFPGSEAGTGDMAEWLLSRGVRVEVALAGGEQLMDLDPREEIPVEPFTIFGAEFELGRRDNPETVERLVQWSGRGSIEELHFEDCRVTSSDLERLADLPSLRRLDLTGARFPGAGLRALAQSDSVEAVTLTRTVVTDQDLRPLAAMAELKTLGILSTRCRGAVLPLFRGLWTLELGDSPIEDGSLAFLDQMTDLESLCTIEVKLVPKAIERMASVRRLQKLQIWDSGLEERALAPLRGHRSLTWLNLQGMALTPAAGSILAEIPALQELLIGDVKKPSDMLAWLRRLRPEMKLPEVCQ